MYVLRPCIGEVAECQGLVVPAVGPRVSRSYRSDRCVKLLTAALLTRAQNIFGIDGRFKVKWCGLRIAKLQDGLPCFMRRDQE